MRADDSPSLLGRTAGQHELNTHDFDYNRDPGDYENDYAQESEPLLPPIRTPDHHGAAQEPEPRISSAGNSNLQTSTDRRGREMESTQPVTEICFDIPEGTSDMTMQSDIKISLEFINIMKKACLEDPGLSASDIYYLQHPLSRSLPNLETDVALKLSLKYFLAFHNHKKTVYADACSRAATDTFPHLTLLSFEECESLTHRISGVSPIFTDMCRNSCVAFTGFFQDLDVCPERSADRWIDTKKKAGVFKQTLTLPVGPSIQALYTGSDSSLAMKYRLEKTKESSLDLDPLQLDDLFSQDLLTLMLAQGNYYPAATKCVCHGIIVLCS